MGIPAEAWGHGFSFTENLQATTVPSGWGDANTFNRNWGVRPGGPYINVAVTWGFTVTAHLDFMPRIPENTCTAVCHVRGDFHRLRGRKLM